ncbi:hypothetical protein BDK51DRAFT_26158, partial [Blyttiomyces helicus]
MSYQESEEVDLITAAYTASPLTVGPPTNVGDALTSFAPAVEPLVPPSPVTQPSPQPRAPTSVSPPASPLPPVTPNQPGRKSRKKTIGETPIVCNTCGTPSGTFLLHGSPTSLAAANEAVFSCAGCELAASFEVAASFVPSPLADEEADLESCDLARRKRKHGCSPGRSSITCNLCTALLGVGGVRPVDTPAMRETGVKPIWIEPGFDIEPICAVCFQMFSFCTD